MKLLVDIGNTRIKWAMLTDGCLSAMQASSYAAWDRRALHTQMLSTLTKPEHILIANVAGDAIARLVTECVAENWSLTPEFVHSTSAVNGVRNGYAMPSQLGVDRWLAVIAAFDLQGSAACIANVGTAMTVDGVDSSGLHLGGVIVPGPDLAIESLLRNTGEIAGRSQAGEVGPTLFAGNTLGAVHQGVTHMLAAIVERTLLEMRTNLGESPALFLTGGASERVAQSLRVPFRTIPDLVLRGLAVLARDGTTNLNRV